jgi:TRAP-type mannitol/chloroaromatic compound transport system permease small subunit
LQNDTHVRVDVFYLNFSPKTQALINIIGSVVFILPISLLITYYGFDFAYLAFEIGEKSGDPGGLSLVFCNTIPIKINKGTAIKIVFCMTLIMR